jgi:hypothetical protein
MIDAYYKKKVRKLSLAEQVNLPAGLSEESGF